jgi:hypothetical protein
LHARVPVKAESHPSEEFKDAPEVSRLNGLVNIPRDGRSLEKVKGSFRDFLNEATLSAARITNSHADVNEDEFENEGIGLGKLMGDESSIGRNKVDCSDLVYQDLAVVSAASQLQQELSVSKWLV